MYLGVYPPEVHTGTFGRGPSEVHTDNGSSWLNEFENCLLTKGVGDK